MELSRQYKIMFAYKGANIKQRIQDAKTTVGWNLSGQNDWGVLVFPKSISMPSKFIKNTSQLIRSMEMSQILHGQMLKILNYFAVAFLVNPFRLLVKGGGSTIQEVLCFLKSLGLHRKNNHAFCSLKTLKGFYLTTKGKLSELSSIRWMNLGMTSNGKCLTVKISVSPRIGKECSLSDILEEHVDQKYFLSEKQTEKVFSGLLLVHRDKVDRRQAYTLKKWTKPEFAD